MSISAKNVSIAYGYKVVLDHVDTSLNRGERIALIGENGAGKSTLLRIIAGLEAPDEGVVHRTPRDEIGYLPQTLAALETETIGDVIALALAGLRHLEDRMRELERAMASSSDPRVLEEYGEVAAHFELRGGYQLGYRIPEVLAGLGVGYLTEDRRVSELSGGEKARVRLASLLIAAPDTLLLDEPTNDLDDRAMQWLEGFLSSYAGGVLFVTHDRDFIDTIATKIVELDEHRHTLIAYEGNYERYLDEKRAARERAQQAYEAQQDEIRQLREYSAATARVVGHGRPAPDRDKSAHNFRGSGVERAVSRNVRNARAKLERIDANRLSPPPEPLRFRGRFATGEQFVGSAAILAEGVVVRYGEEVVLDHVSCRLEIDDRVCAVGQNGAGKSTLLRVLAGLQAPDAGTVTHSKMLRIGYLPQEPRLPLPSRKVLDNVAHRLRDVESVSLEEVAGSLVRWGLLEREDLHKRVTELSVGQQRKVEIGILIALQPNALILDEPTNHLSFDVIESLQQALTQFAGPVLIATHDRRLLREFPRKLWTIASGRSVESIRR
ncbi:MAG: ABC-F family ATP-binding cassette domain-containing protein [Candidatus Eremiobacteraeota bacterium]|nr:ABC-F family ATP-binding cassette domain-containing protein [Candidatus Eremiobacteraeota bacterium]